MTAVTSSHGAGHWRDRGRTAMVTLSIAIGVLGVVDLSEGDKVEVTLGPTPQSSSRPVPVVGTAFRGEEPMYEQLTERERMILQELAQGKSNQEIAETLFLAEGTIKNYVSTIMAKLHANDRTQAAIYALKRGLAKLE